jgi:hypothetical protein
LATACLSGAFILFGHICSLDALCAWTVAPALCTGLGITRVQALLQRPSAFLFQSVLMASNASADRALGDKDRNFAANHYHVDGKFNQLVRIGQGVV